MKYILGTVCSALTMQVFLFNKYKKVLQWIIWVLFSSICVVELVAKHVGSILNWIKSWPKESKLNFQYPALVCRWPIHQLPSTVSFNLTHAPVFPQTIFLVEWTYYSKLVPGSVVHAPYFHTIFFFHWESYISTN